MLLLADYVYTDVGATKWVAPEGAVIDGASIPQILWSLIGGPFEGKYRKASVVHDVACDTKDRPWQAVHRMFYSAMRCSGVERRKAVAMYFAVYHCGPRWGTTIEPRLLPCGDSELLRKRAEKFGAIATASCPLCMTMSDRLVQLLIQQMTAEDLARIDETLEGDVPLDWKEPSPSDTDFNVKAPHDIE